jgi:methanogenic corrinoid protein MtbC1
MLGGVPVTKDMTDLFGADGYAGNARKTDQEAINMISRLMEKSNK